MFIFSFNMTQHLLLVVLIYSCSKTKAQGLHPPKLTVNPPVITETDSVTLNCQTPSSVSVTQCFFYFMRGKPAKTFSCLKTLTGTELLMMTNQNSPAEVEVTCFYFKVNQSPESSMSSIMIQSPRPKLTVNTPVITETDSVTLTCQTPSSVSVDQCQFNTLKGQRTFGNSSCLQTLTGTELMMVMTDQKLPAEVKVKCFYTVKFEQLFSRSPDSETSSIIINRLHSPKLTVNPAVITETDSVTLNCQTPSSVSVDQCQFNSLKGLRTIGNSSCLQTLTGTELMMMTDKKLPAEVKVKCFYTVKLEQLFSRSPDSETSSIIINPHPPKLTMNPSVINNTDSVTLNCQPPSSVSVGQCFFYTVSGGTVRELSCQDTLTGIELQLMAHQNSSAEVEVKCFYTVKLGELHFISPDSETSSITINCLHPPKLTVNPPVITETDSVTLNCQTPSSVSVTQCFFYFMRGKPAKTFSCLKTLTGTELLMMTNQNSPAEVEVTCFYFKVYQSPESSMSSIMIQPPRPKLTVNTPVITETDSVTLNCQTPSSVSVDQCQFNTLKGLRTFGNSSCLQTLTGTELMMVMTDKRLPAEVKMKCLYTVKLEHLISTSPDSETSSIIINRLHPAKLTVNPPVITETDSVTLNCQTPSSVSVDQCQFITLKGLRTFGNSSCLQTLTGTELMMMMTDQKLPAEVKVKCFYTVKLEQLFSRSPDSETSSIIINPPRPKLTVNPPVITETDSVTLNCQTPSSVSVDQCQFITLKGFRTIGDSSCLQTLTGTELMKVTNQRLPAEVKVKCSYTVNLGELQFISPDSETSPIIINRLHPPKLTVSLPLITETDSVTLNCQTPSSVSVDQCHFYFVREQTSTFVSCLKKLSGAELMKMTRQSSPAEVEVTCYYTVEKRGALHQSLHSNISSIIIQLAEIQSNMTQTMPTSTMVTVSESEVTTTEWISSNKTINPPPGNNRSGTLMWKLLVVVGGVGVTVGVISLCLALLCAKRDSGKSSHARPQANNSDDFLHMTSINHGGLLPADCNEDYHLVSPVPGGYGPTDCKRLNRQASQNESDTYHFYHSISSKPAPAPRHQPALNDMTYSTLQEH
ncbi:uncharacterized protein LOC113154443 isoform X3 [Anabas testudineus]|uniref:uncharacterized protein LOC113154443 isoform X3 n=1 Tax=Anabas testudineus TaxID=64144 RepID=UPI000E460125|nr:uncharacterized protein LOC113154443 isoform X3 [Anabas testudineus]